MIGGSFANRAAIVLLVAGALAVRWDPLTGRDLYNDEALQTTITRSFLEDGSLNNFRYSTFTPGSQFSRGIWVYYPPGLNFIQAPFLLMDPSSPVAARLPALVLNLFALVCLPILSRAVWSSAAPGWTAAILGALSPVHIGMSVTSLSYAFVAPILVFTFGALVRALGRRRDSDWIAVGLFVVLGFYVMPIALAFCALLAAVLAWGWFHRRADATRGVLIAAAVIAVLCAPWVLWAWGTTSTLHNMVFRAPAYSFAGQARLVLEQYDLMLPSLVWKLAFLVGLAVVARRATKESGLLGGLLGAWALAPLLYMLARNMWLTPRHVFCAQAAVMLITGLGMTTATRWLAVLVSRADAQGQARPAMVAVGATLLLASVQLAVLRAGTGSRGPYRPIDQLLRGDAAIEFGNETIVSRACAFIREHDGGEPVIAPVGQSEAHYLGRFVHDRRTAEATARAWALVQSGPAWVFMGDNYFRSGALDDFDRAVQRHGRLVMRSAPVQGFTTPENTLGYALYYLDRPLPLSSGRPSPEP